jgi:hypothetical protein
VVVIAINPAQMAGALSEVMVNLPAILDNLQIITYILLILFFGSIAVLGFRIYAPFWKRILIRIGFGFLCLFSGAAIAIYMPFHDSIIGKLIQLDLLIGGVVASIIFAISLFILSKGISSENTIKRAIEKLEERLKKEHSKPKPKNTLTGPYFLAGIVIIILLLLFSAANFRGFPSFQDSMMSAFGMTSEDFESLQNVLGSVKDLDMPEGIMEIPTECTNAYSAISRNTDAMSNLVDYDNPTLKTNIESEAGETVIDMKSVEVEGLTIVVALTQTGKTCFASEDIFCACQ